MPGRRLALTLSQRPSQITQAGKAGKAYTGTGGPTWTEGTRGRKPAWLTRQLAEGDALGIAEAEAQ